MARKNSKAQSAKPVTNNQATASIIGILDSVYGGKKYDYAKVKVYHDYDEYYDLFNVACGKDFELPDDGDEITLLCNIKTYKGDVTFKEIHADEKK